MIYSKLLVFDEDDKELDINKRISEFENAGWEVVEHKLTSSHSGISERVKITVLLQKQVEVKEKTLSSEFKEVMENFIDSLTEEEIDKIVKERIKNSHKEIFFEDTKGPI